MYPNDMSIVSYFSQFKINDIYVDDDSSEKIRYMIQLIILKLISPLESGDLYSKTNYEDGLRMTKILALGLKESVLEDKLHNALFNDISNLKKRDTYHFDGSLCDCIDYVINLDDYAALSDARYSLKKVFLCKDDFNTDAIFLMRKALLEDKRNSYLLNIEEINPKSRDLVSLYSVDAAIIVDMCGKNFIGNIPNINDVNFFNGRIKDYVIYVVGLIYARRLLDVFTLIVARVDDSDIYEKNSLYFYQNVII